MAEHRTWNQCRKKHRYRDEHSANLYRRKCEINQGVKLDYYWCPYCNGFHLTSETFRPEGYGLSVSEEGQIVYVRSFAKENQRARSYYMGKKNRIRIDANEYMRMLAM